MLHLFDQVRAPLDAFEQTIINALSPNPNVEGIWVREVPTKKPRKLNGNSPGHVPVGGGPRKRWTRVVFIQLHRQSLGTEREVQSLANELCLRAEREPFELEVRVVVDDLPPASVAPSCIYRRMPQKVEES